LRVASEKESVLTEQVSEADLREYITKDPVVAAQQLNDKVGMKLLEATAERVVGTMPVEGNLQPYGLLHGGANAVLAEALGSTVAALNAGPDKATMGLELSCTHHRAVRSGLVTGVATPLHVGRGTITVDVTLTDDQGRRTCTARLTCIVRDKPPGA
jgi:1,4-dihydroxy-2-naphthoyl-CoA hydrolase